MRTGFDLHLGFPLTPTMVVDTDAQLLTRAMSMTRANSMPSISVRQDSEDDAAAGLKDGVARTKMPMNKGTKVSSVALCRYQSRRSE